MNDNQDEKNLLNKNLYSTIELGKTDSLHLLSPNYTEPSLIIIYESLNHKSA